MGGGNALECRAASASGERLCEVEAIAADPVDAWLFWSVSAEKNLAFAKEHLDSWYFGHCGGDEAMPECLLFLTCETLCVPQPGPHPRNSGC